MAEVKNSFLGSKMNQDLDDRLIPSNQYREGINISVSNSEENDVGALETILGNQLKADLGQTVIGVFVSENTNTIFLFTTDYTDTSFNKLNNFAPSSATCKIYAYNVLTDVLTTLVSGFFLNFSTTHNIYGVNLIENLLFWTDNRNQPRKINVQTAASISNYYTTEDHVSVAKYAPFKTIELYEETSSGSGVYKTTMKDVTSATEPDGTTNPDLKTDFAGDPDFLTDKFVRFSYRFKFDDGEYSIIAPYTQTAFIPKQDGSFIDKYDGSGNLIESDEDDAYKSSVVKFMENKVDSIKLIIPFEYQLGQLKNKLKISHVEILMKESDSNSVRVVEELPISQFTGTDTFYGYDYQSTKPTKVLPSNQTTRVYDKVPVRALGQEVASNRVIYSNYVNKHTAPLHLDYSVNVSDKFSSNAAFTSRALEEYPEQTLKQNRNYQVGVVLSDRYGRQSGVILTENTTALITDGGLKFGSSTIYSPYEVNNASNTSNDPKTWQGNSLKVLFNSAITSAKSPLTEEDNASETGEPGLYVEPNSGIVENLSVFAIGSGYNAGTYSTIVTTGGSGTGLKVTITVNSGAIVSAIVSEPGSGYNVNDTIGLVGAGGAGGALKVISLQEPNPLGWYSYKIVVKQSQQEYYNVYVPDIINGNITTGNANAQEENIAFISLISDNINKVPRGLQEVGPEQKQFGSDAILYPRVNTPSPSTNIYNEMWEANNEGSFVSTISTLDDLAGSDQSGNTSVYQAESNPLVAKFLTPFADLGRTYASNTSIILGVLETAPVESLLDIYWETSTTGLISDLNQTIANSNPNEPSYIIDWNFDLTEGENTGANVSSSNFKIKTTTGASFNATVSIVSVTDGSGVDRTSDFSMVAGGNNTAGFNIKTDDTFYFGPNADINETYTFKLNVTNTTASISKEMILEGSLVNVSPTIFSVSMPTTYVGMPNPIVTVSGVNGAFATADKTKDLSWTFDNGSTSFSPTNAYNLTFNIQPTATDGQANITYNYDTSYPPNATFNLGIVLTDAGSATATATVTINFTRGEFDPSQFSTAFNL